MCKGCKIVFFRMNLLLICGVFFLYTGVRAIRVIGRDATVTTEDDAQLFCQLEETTEKLTSITWQRRTREKPTNTNFFAVTADGQVKHINGLGERVKFTGDLSKFIGSISLSKVTSSDEGIYTCIVNIFPSGPFEKEITLTVQVPPTVSVSTDVPPVSGDTEAILATCTAANAKPAADVSWSLSALKDSVEVKSNITVDSEGRYTVKSSLIGVASKKLNQKKVQCLVTHPALKKNLEQDYTLNIHYPPQVVYVISTGVQEGTRTFLCESDANPEPTNYNWSRHSPVKYPVSSAVDRLTIQHSLDSNGLYFCEVANPYGTAVGSIYVDIIPPTNCSTCWTLFIISLLAVGAVFVTWKLNFHQQIIKRLRGDRSEPVPTE